MTEMQSTIEKHNQSPTLVEFNFANLDESFLRQLMKMYADSYGELWIGDDRYKSETLPNVDVIDALMINGKIVAAVDLNKNRIITIAVNQEFQGKGFGVKLFKEVAKRHPDVWISIGENAVGMLNTVTNKELNYYLVEDKEKIEELYKGINGVSSDFTVETHTIDSSFLTKRFKTEKGLDKKQFTAFTRSGSLHDSSYNQLLFQNKS